MPNENSPVDVSNAVDESAKAASPPNHYLRMTVSLGVLAAIAIIASLYLARTFFMPLLVSILASYTLSPLVNWLKACHLPRPAGAALVLVALVGGLTWLTLSLGDDATAMIERLPEATRQLRQHLSDTRSPNQSALQNMQEAAKQLEGVAADAGAKRGSPVKATNPSEPSTWLHDYAITQSLLLFEVLAQAPIVLLITYFLLASGEHFRLKLIQFVGPSLARQKDTVHMLEEINVQIQLYMLSMLVASVLVGIATWLAFKALGIEQAGVWGVIACVLQFIPYLGPVITATAGGIASYLQFGSLLHALGTAGISMLLAIAIGFVFTTWLQSRFAHVNAAVLFIALLFFAWLWGVWGLFLGAPLVAIIRVICDRVDTLKPIGKLLGP
jgi:predicted PurR-regulated permease PerM